MAITDLSARMKRYEIIAFLPRRTYTIMRLDGVAFHTFLRDAVRPFDTDFMTGMNIVTEQLCKRIQGAVLGYVQSDEISILLTDFREPGTEAWYGGDIQKMTSVSAAWASVILDRNYAPPTAGAFPAFDSRVFPVPSDVEAANYFLSRQQDAQRNAVSAIARVHFSAGELMNKSTGERIARLAEKGMSLDDFPEECFNGRVVYREYAPEDVKLPSGRSVNVPVNRWICRPAPEFEARPGTFLASLIPTMPSLKEGSTE